MRARHLDGCAPSRSRDARRQMRGTVLVELALIVPVILFVAGFTVRLIQILQAKQIASVLSREIATDVYRNCIDFTLHDRTIVSGVEQLVVDTQNTAAILTTCLARIRNRFAARWDALRPAGTQSTTALNMELWVYRYNFGSLAVNDPECDEATTRIAWSGEVIESLDIDPDAMCQKNRAVRVEVSFNITPSLVFLSLIPGSPVPNTVTITDTTDI
jgi:hypothetical protein